MLFKPSLPHMLRYCRPTAVMYRFRPMQHYAILPGPRVRYGAGLGSSFSRLYSAFTPVVRGTIDIGRRASQTQLGQELITDAKKVAMQAGLNVVSDALSGKNIASSARRELKKAEKRMLSTVGKRVALKVLAKANDVDRGLHAAAAPKRRARRRGYEDRVAGAETGAGPGEQSELDADGAESSPPRQRRRRAALPPPDLFDL